MTDPCPDDDALSDQFAESLTQLAEFKAYFTDKEKIETLVEWVQEEFNVSKATARLLVKTIAPFVIARLASVGKIVGKAWMRKLNERLSQYRWYFGGTQRLLGLLKTRTDNSFELALAIPATENLEVLIKDDAKWANLKPEYQGFIQLLLGQNDLSEGQSALREQFKALTQSLSFDLDLKTPERIAKLSGNPEAGSVEWLTYDHRQAELVGRGDVLQQLDEFIDHDELFSWWLVTGPGGIGKSRLALDLMIRHQHHWELGFLSEDKLNKADALSGWQPAFPTLIVIDYAARYAKNIGYWLDYLIEHQDDLLFPVRVLILERETQQQAWWEDYLAPATTGGNVRKRALFSATPLELAPLTRPQQRQCLKHFLSSLGGAYDLPDENDAFWESLNTLSDQGRPLFIGMVAVAIHEGKGLAHIRNWQKLDLLNYVLKREQRMWDTQLSNRPEPQRDKIYDLMAFASIVGGLSDQLDHDRLIEGLSDADISSGERELDQNWSLATQLSTKGDACLQPDIFAEYFVLQRWPAAATRLSNLGKARVLAAYRLAPIEMMAFLMRAAVDFPEDPTPFHWWQCLWSGVDKPEQSLLADLAIGIVGQLSLHGQYTLAIEQWLPTLMQSEHPKSKAQALDMMGKQLLLRSDHETALDYLEQSLEMRQKIGDKSGVGTTLINISQVFRVRGDYKASLDYLKQALEIQQEIGDKPGKGTTLNNIALVFHARGDYDTALDYLEQSLEIQQEIGNKLGIGTSLSNISQVFQARGNYKAALDYLKRSLVIRQEIGDKSGVAATQNYISLVFLARRDYDTALDHMKQSLEIRQEIGDKSGEGTTLNNISQVFKARGDYKASLDYLQQSLEIQQEIGDKPGKGTTLNNIALVFHARGDYETALDYLKQSLEIQQEIGDIAGLCATMFNMGHNHLRNKQQREAMQAWLQVYGIAKRIELAQALDALEGLAEQLGIADGLQGWEALWQKHQSSDE